MKVVTRERVGTLISCASILTSQHNYISFIPDRHGMFCVAAIPAIHAATACRLSGCPAAVCRCGQVRERRLRKRAREGKDDLTKGFVSPIMAYLRLFSNENTTLPRLKDNVVCLVDSSLLRITFLRLFPQREK